MLTGEKIKQLRKKHRYSQAGIAALLGVAQTTVSAWETGYRRIHFEELERIASVLGEPIAAFCKDEAQKEVQGGHAVLTEILKIKGDWQEVVDDCRATVGKDELGKEPSKAFRRDIMIAEHSPIRDLIIKWRWKDIPYWVTTHWARHKWEKFISTQRSDRTGIPREKLPQDEPQTFRGEANAQNLIDTMRKRLCFTAAQKTREYAEDLKLTLHDMEPELSDVLVPNCVYRGGCPEMDGCDKWSQFVLWCMKEREVQVVFCTIAERYALYNEWFRSQRGNG